MDRLERIHRLVGEGAGRGGGREVRQAACLVGRRKSACGMHAADDNMLHLGSGEGRNLEIPCT